MNAPTTFRAGRAHARSCAASAHFAAFYAAAVRRQAGSRLSADAVRNAYITWADQAGAKRLGFKAIKREMEARGHRHVKSCTMAFADAVLIAPLDFRLPSAALHDPARPLLAELDQLAALVADMRFKVLSRSASADDEALP